MATKLFKTRHLISEILDDGGNLSQGVCTEGYTNEVLTHFRLTAECQWQWIQIRKAIGYKFKPPFSFSYKDSS